ncbi:T9SS type A sorting domain-containing protein [candidate division KSB1 bacterium]|nr:T9SS type A sorting domain-containing protein [candidate division KSB1 bacterium]
MKIRHVSFLFIATILFIINLFSFVDVFAQAPHSVGGRLEYSDGTHPASVTWSAYLTKNPGKTINQDAPGSEYYGASSGEFIIQISGVNALPEWSAGDVLHIDFNDGDGYTASLDVTLTTEPYEYVGTVTLIRYPRQITITTNPSGLQFIADGSTYTAPHTFTWEQGSGHTLDVTSPQSLGVTGVQYTFASWSDGGSKLHSYTVPLGDEILTAAFNTQYQLNIISPHGNPQGGGWYNAGTGAQFSITSPESGGTGKQFVFTGWTGSGSGSYTGTQTTYTVVMNNPITETAGWKTQFRLTTGVSPAGSGTVTANPSGTWFDSSAVVGLSATANSGFMWSKWSGDLSGTTNPVNITMNAPKNVTANFGKPVQITINTSPANRRFSVDGSNYTTPQTFTWAENSLHNISVTTPQAGTTGIQYTFTAWSPGGSTAPVLTYTVPGTNQTITANFKTQYELSVISERGEPSGAGWYDAGSNAQFSVTTPVSGGTGTQYVFTGWTGSGNGSYTGTQTTYTVIMNNPMTETASWKKQYYLTVNSGFGNPQGQGWYDSGATAAFSVTSPDVRGNTKYIFLNWSGAYNGSETGHSISMNAPKTVTAAWKTQHYLTTAENPDAGGDMTPVPPGGWYDENEVVNLNATVNTGYAWGGWSGSLSGTIRPTLITMDTSKSVTANFNKVSQITVKTNIDGFEFSVDEANYYSARTFSWIVGSTHTLATASPQDYNATPYIFTSWSDGGTINHTYTVADKKDTVTAFFEPREFKLTMAVEPLNTGSTTPAVGVHVYNPGQVVSISAVPISGYRFIKWIGDVDSPDSPATTVTMDDNKAVIAKFIRIGDVRVTTDPEGLRIVVDQTAYTSPQDFHWTPGTNHTISIDSTTQNRGSGTRFIFQRWSDDGAAAHQITVNEEYIYTAEFLTRYKLTTADDPAAGGSMTPAPPGNWYDMGTRVEVKARPDTLNGYIFSGWSGDLSGKTNPDSVLMDGPKIITAKYTRMLNVRINTVPDSMSVIVDEIKYTSPCDFTWEDGSTHSLGADTLKSDGPGKRYIFDNWSDAKPLLHTVTVMSDTVFTASYNRQYYLSTFVDPADGGSITPAAPGAWFDRDSRVELLAKANTNLDYIFSEWTGALTGNQNPDTLTLDAPKSVTAHFRSSDDQAPILSYVYPADGSKQIPRNESIQFKVTDTGTGIKLNSLQFYVNNKTIVKNGLDFTGGLATVKYTGKSCSVFYDPPEYFMPDSTITLNIQCQDLSRLNNMMDSTAGFVVGAATVACTKTDTLDQNGGVVFDDSTGIVMFVPDSALTDTTILTIGRVNSYPELPADDKEYQTAVHFGPSGLRFADSVTVTIPYDQSVLDNAGVARPEDLTVYYYSVFEGSWHTLKIINSNAQNIYVKIKELCYLVYGEKNSTYSEPGKFFGPTTFELSQNYPNPFNPQTTIKYQVPQNVYVTLEIFNINGQKIKTLIREDRMAGYYTVVWDGTNDYNMAVSTGMYFLKMKAGEYVKIIKMSFLK